MQRNERISNQAGCTGRADRGASRGIPQAARCQSAIKAKEQKLFAPLFFKSQRSRHQDPFGSACRQSGPFVSTFRLDRECGYCGSDPSCHVHFHLFQTVDSLEAIRYITPFNNGVFNQLIAYPEITQENTLAEYFYFKANRIIGGFYANESIIISGSGEVEYEGERITHEDLESIPDLEELINSLDIDHIPLPHINTDKPIIEKKVDVIGQYIKNNGVVYGHVELSWEILVRDDQDLKIGYDYLHIVMPDGSYRQIEPDELKNYLGDYLYTNNENYGLYPYIPSYS